MMAAHTAGEKDLVEVKRRSPPEKQQRRTTRSLDRGDVATLQESALLEQARVVGLRPVWEEAHWKGEHRNVAIVGTRGDALDLYRLKMERGRYFNRDDHADRRRVAVVGQRVWTELLQRTEDLEQAGDQDRGRAADGGGRAGQEAQLEGRRRAVAVGQPGAGARRHLRGDVPAAPRHRTPGHRSDLRAPGRDSPAGGRGSARSDRW